MVLDHGGGGKTKTRTPLHGCPTATISLSIQAEVLWGVKGVLLIIMPGSQV